MLCKSVLFISLSDLTSELLQVNSIRLLKLVFEFYNLGLQLLKDIIFNFPVHVLQASANNLLVVFFLVWEIWSCDSLSEWAFAFSDWVAITKAKQLIKDSKN